jgi:hypothetical protein
MPNPAKSAKPPSRFNPGGASIFLSKIDRLRPEPADARRAMDYGGLQEAGPFSNGLR